MKKFYILIAIVGIFLLANGFKVHSEMNTKLTEWGEWMNDDCFKGIDYRVKRGDYNSYAGKWYWYVQFRNRYVKPVYYSYAVDEPGTLPEPDHRDNMKGENLSDSKGFLLINSNRVHVRVGYLRFGDHDSGAYAKCDQ